MRAPSALLAGAVLSRRRTGSCMVSGSADSESEPSDHIRSTSFVRVSSCATISLSVTVAK